MSDKKNEKKTSEGIFMGYRLVKFEVDPISIKRDMERDGRTDRHTDRHRVIAITMLAFEQ